MPFTLSHPAAVLPLQRWSKSRLPLAALVIGAMTPDAAYFIRLSLGSESHSLLGIAYFCWPVGMIIWFAFEFFLKLPTLDLLPSSLRNRIPRRTVKISISSLVAGSLAILIGSMTHIVWDSFTHANSPVVIASEILRVPVVTIGDDTIRIYKILQHASTVFGGLVLVNAVLRWWRSSHDTHQHAVPNEYSSTYRLCAVAFVLFATLAGAAIGALHYRGSLERVLFFICIGGMTGFALAWCVAVFWIRLTQQRRTEMELS